MAVKCNLNHSTFDCATIDYQCVCILNPILQLLASKWTSEIITLLGYYESLRFTKLQHHLNMVSPTTLTRRLYELVEKELIHKRQYAETPARINYSLSKKGDELWQALQPLIQFKL